VALKRKKFRTIIIIVLFFVYFVLAARPVPREVILAPKWISSLQSQTLSSEQESPPGSESLLVNISGDVQETGRQNLKLLPFILGSHFGYVDSSGQFTVNRNIINNIYLSNDMWSEYNAEPARIEIKNIQEETIINIENPQGYPVLLDNRVFILGSEQNSLSEIDRNGNIRWSYEFGSPLTCVDAGAGLLLTGSLDGIIEIFNYYGERIFYFEPGGSRYGIILGCAVSGDGSRIGIISGIDQQRFLLLERFGNSDGESGGDYKVVYHEFLDDGFRRHVRILFVDEDRRLVFERSGGINCYNIRTRQGIFIPLDGEIKIIEDSGDQGFLFLVTSHGFFEKKLIGINFPQDSWFPFSFSSKNGFTDTDAIFLKAPFKSDDVFLGRTGTMLVAGGGTALISFVLEEN